MHMYKARCQCQMPYFFELDFVTEPGTQELSQTDLSANSRDSCLLSAGIQMYTVTCGLVGGD